MDPQLRLMMEVAYEAIVDGGEELNEGCWVFDGGLSPLKTPQPRSGSCIEVSVPIFVSF